jgi:hypothetical protein
MSLLAQKEELSVRRSIPILSSGRIETHVISTVVQPSSITDDGREPYRRQCNFLSR